MFIVWQEEIYNLNEYYRIKKGANDRHNARRIYLDIRAGGAIEADGRHVLEFETLDQRDEVFDLISAFLATGHPCFDIQGHLEQMEEEIDVGLSERDG